MIYDILEAKIQAAGLGVIGQSIFREAMPPDITKGVMFRSPLNGINIDPHMPGFYKPKLQCIVRATDPVIGRQICHEIIAAVLVEKPEVHAANAERGRVKISLFYPKQLPIQFPRLEGNGIEFSIHFTTAFSVVEEWM